MEADISRRISIARLILIFGIIVIHVPPSLSLAELGASPFDIIRGFFTQGLFRGSVPVLTMISGYLVFSSGIDRRFSALVKKKSRSLLLPLILWNLPLLFLVFYIQYKGAINHSFSATLYPFDGLSWLNALTGITGVTINYPLNFLRDLYVLALLSPLLGLLIRKAPWLGLLGIMALFYSTYDGRLIYNNNMPINFYLGGMAAVYCWDLKKWDPYAIPALIGLCAICLAITLTDFSEPRLFKTLSPFLIWPALSLLANNRVGDLFVTLSKYSFFVFLSHGPVLFAVAFVYGKWGHFITFELYWVMTPFVVLALCILSHVILKMCFPRFTAFILGGR